MLTKHRIIEEMVTDEQWRQIEAHEAQASLTRDQRADEAAYLVDVAAGYDWRKAELEDYRDYLADLDFWRSGCW